MVEAWSGEWRDGVKDGLRQPARNPGGSQSPDERDYEIVTVVGELLQRRSRSAVVRDGPRCWCVNSVNSVIAGAGL